MRTCTSCADQGLTGCDGLEHCDACAKVKPPPCPLPCPQLFHWQIKKRGNPENDKGAARRQGGARRAVQLRLPALPGRRARLRGRRRRRRRRLQAVRGGRCADLALPSCGHLAPSLRFCCALAALSLPSCCAALSLLSCCPHAALLLGSSRCALAALLLPSCCPLAKFTLSLLPSRCALILIKKYLHHRHHDRRNIFHWKSAMKSVAKNVSPPRVRRTYTRPRRPRSVRPAAAAASGPSAAFADRVGWARISCNICSSCPPGCYWDPGTYMQPNRYWYNNLLAANETA